MSTPPPSDRRSALRALLMDYTAVDAAEQDYRSRMLALTRSGADPFARSSFSPGHFTASAFILSPRADALLMILHGKLKRWLQPGGHVDADDPDLIAAARREVHEEAGVRNLSLARAGIFDVDIHSIPALGGDPAHEHFDIRFVFRARGKQLRSGSDAEGARWIPIESVCEAESDRSVMRAVQKLRASAVLGG